MPENVEKATVAAGCFWGVEHLYRRRFGNGKGLLDARVGYCGGDTNSPTYRNVCLGATGRELIVSANTCIQFISLYFD
jgi:peptide methionine sulfoxide reductase MsrA